MVPPRLAGKGGGGRRAVRLVSFLVAALSLVPRSEACVVCARRRWRAPGVGAQRCVAATPTNQAVAAAAAGAGTAFVAVAPARADDGGAGRRLSEVSSLGGDEARLGFVALGFGVFLLVDAGRDAVDPATEPELANFQSTENRFLDLTAFTLLRGYKRAVSPNLPKNCRFFPTCSEYAALALTDHGFLRGLVLACWRVVRCSPVGGRGYDYPAWPPPAYNAGTPIVGDDLAPPLPTLRSLRSLEAATDASSDGEDSPKNNAIETTSRRGPSS